MLGAFIQFSCSRVVIFNSFKTLPLASGSCLSLKGILIGLYFRIFEVINEPMYDQLSKGEFSPGFRLTRSHRDLPTFIPPGHHLHPGSDQQEVTEHSDQPSLPGSSAHIHLFLLRQTPDMWRQKNCILSQAEYRKHHTQYSGSAWNLPYL